MTPLGLYLCLCVYASLLLVASRLPLRGQVILDGLGWPLVPPRPSRRFWVRWWRLARYALLCALLGRQRLSRAVWAEVEAHRAAASGVQGSRGAAPFALVQELRQVRQERDDALRRLSLLETGRCSCPSCFVARSEPRTPLEAPQCIRGVNYYGMPADCRFRLLDDPTHLCSACEIDIQPRFPSPPAGSDIVSLGEPPGSAPAQDGQ